MMLRAQLLGSTGGKGALAGVVVKAGAQIPAVSVKPIEFLATLGLFLNCAVNSAHHLDELVISDAVSFAHFFLNFRPT